MRRIIIRNGKKYIVNTPDYSDSEVDSVVQAEIFSSQIRGAGFLDSAGSGSIPSSAPVYPPVIGLNPYISPQTTSSGAIVYFSSFAGPAGPFDYITYQWQKGTVNLTDGGTITGSRTTTLIITSASAASSGTYRMVATNQYGQITSSNGVLTII